MATTKEAIDIVDQLQTWIEDRDGLSEIPHAWVTATAYSLSVGIGPWTLWDDADGYSDEHDEEELSVDGCIKAFTAAVEALIPFMER